MTTRFKHPSPLLTRAREILLSDGWCADCLKDERGRHCAVGAVLEAYGVVFNMGTTGKAQRACVSGDGPEFDPYKVPVIVQALTVLDESTDKKYGRLIPGCAINLYEQVPTRERRHVIARFDAAIAAAVKIEKRAAAAAKTKAMAAEAAERRAAARNKI